MTPFGAIGCGYGQTAMDWRRPSATNRTGHAVDGIAPALRGGATSIEAYES
jgi:hypothetical protein